MEYRLLNIIKLILLIKMFRKAITARPRLMDCKSAARPRSVRWEAQRLGREAVSLMGRKASGIYSKSTE